MRRKFLKTTVMAVALLVIGSGVALAASMTGTNGDDTIKGTPKTDRQAGGGGNDKIFGQGGGDFLFGDQGANGMNDTMYGGDGDDFINAADGTDGDVVNGGSVNETNGDTCVVDPGDRITSSTGGPLVNVPSGNPPVDPTGTTCENITVVGQ